MLCINKRLYGSHRPHGPYRPHWPNGSDRPDGHLYLRVPLQRRDGRKWRHGGLYGQRPDRLDGK